MRFAAAFTSAILVLSAACASAPSKTDSPAEMSAYTSQPGDLPVGVIPEVALIDNERNRELDLTIEYPIKDGAYPVVIFSTGFGAPSRTYVGLTSYWASHGYVTIKIGHPGTDPEVADVAEAWKNQTPQDWRNRVRDVTYVIDSLNRLQDRYPELKGKVDANRLGVGGHSYGAFVAMLLAGAKTFDDGAATSYADSRVKAVIAMSPQGPSEARGLTAESWSEVRIPILYLTGSSDTDTVQSENEAWRKQAYDLSPAGDKWFISIAGAGHFAFTGRTTAPVAVREPDMRIPIDSRDPRDPRRQPNPVPNVDANPGMPRRVDTGFYSARQSLGVIQTVSLAFWDTYLDNSAPGREYLSKLHARGDMTVETK